ncbi:MAG: c-type cytochrome [Sphingobacteriales bacterium]|nr:MAG: c-type cytochrome [Sphingobacteriales bacterium]
MKVLVKKIIRKKMLIASLLLLVAIAGSAFFQQKEWKAPASADAKKNPLTADATTIAAGKTVYVKECQSCHGKKGKGDGPSAKDLDIPAGDFTKAVTQSQSDGALFWKISEGRKPMPSFKKKLNETQIWQSVVYMRTLKQ